MVGEVRPLVLVYCFSQIGRYCSLIFVSFATEWRFCAATPNGRIGLALSVQLASCSRLLLWRTAVHRHGFVADCGRISDLQHLPARLSDPRGYATVFDFYTKCRMEEETSDRRSACSCSLHIRSPSLERFTVSNPCRERAPGELADITAHPPNPAAPSLINLVVVPPGAEAERNQRAA